MRIVQAAAHRDPFLLALVAEALAEIDRIGLDGEIGRMRATFTGELQTCESVTLTYITRLEGETCVNIYSYTKRLAFAAFPGKHAA